MAEIIYANVASFWQLLNHLEVLVGMVGALSGLNDFKLLQRCPSTQDTYLHQHPPSFGVKSATGLLKPLRLTNHLMTLWLRTLCPQVVLPDIARQVSTAKTPMVSVGRPSSSGLRVAGAEERSYQPVKCH